MSVWIREKMKVAMDESYRELTNLQSKLQKHQAFEAELLSNRAGIEAVCKVSLICFTLIVILKLLFPDHRKAYFILKNYFIYTAFVLHY